MASKPMHPEPLPSVATETFEQAAIRLHALLDDYLAIARSQKEADQGLRATQTPARKIDGNEFAIREDIAETCRRVAAMVVNPVDEMMVISYQGPNLAAMRSVIDLDIANLVPLEGDIAIEDLATKAGVDPDLLERLLRVLASNYIFTKTRAGHFGHTQFSATLRDQNMADLMQMGMNVGLTSSAAAFELWRSQGWKNPSSKSVLPFQKGHNTDLGFFEYLSTIDTDLGQRFNAAMAGLGAYTQVLTLDTFPFNEIMEKEDTVFVDIGGGQGPMMKKVLARWPGMKAKIVVQDLPHTIQSADAEGTGIEFMAHNFFEEQPVKGADYYFLRRILHDWPDDSCVEILRHLVQAMKPTSKIIIVDFVMDEIDAPRYKSASDIMMCLFLAGGERTERQWRKLLAATDSKLRLEKIWAHPLNKEYVLEVALN